MRREVVFPAPLGPSRAVTQPSWARNDTSSTASFVPKRFCSPWASIIVASLRRGAGRIDHERRPADLADARGVDPLGPALLDELGDQVRHAAGHGCVVSGPRDDHVKG